MGTSVVIDASVLVSWLVTTDVHHEASRDWIERYNALGGFLAAPSFLVVEVAAAIARNERQSEKAKAAVKLLYSVKTLRLVNLSPTLIRSAVNIASDLQLRAGDTMYVAVAHALRLPLVSWDKEQLTRAAGLITTYSPDIYPFNASDEA